MCHRTSSQRCWSAESCRDQLLARLIDRWEFAEVEFAEHGENFSVENGCAGCSANGVVREQRELPIEDVAGAQTADSGGHAVAAHEVEARLRARVFGGVLDGRDRSRGQMQAIEAAATERLEGSPG